MEKRASVSCAFLGLLNLGMYKYDEFATAITGYRRLISFSLSGFALAIRDTCLLPIIGATVLNTDIINLIMNTSMIPSDASVSECYARINNVANKQLFGLKRFVAFHWS